MIFLFEGHPEKLLYLEKLKEEDEKDTNRKRANLRKECRKQLQQMKRTVKNSPIFLVVIIQLIIILLVNL